MGIAMIWVLMMGLIGLAVSIGVLFLMFVDVLHHDPEVDPDWHKRCRYCGHEIHPPEPDSK